MTPRNLLRLVLVTFGALALGALGAAVLGSGPADATTAPAPLGLAPQLAEASNGGTPVGIGPLAVDLPVAVPLAEPLDLTIPVPVAPPEIAAIPLIPVGTLATLVPGGALPGSHLLPELGAAPSPFSAPASAGAPAPDTRPLAPTLESAATPVTAAPSGEAPAVPVPPFTPWTLALAGAGALVAAAAEGRHHRDGSPLIAALDPIRSTTAKLVGLIGAPRNEPSRAGFALLLARPG